MTQITVFDVVEAAHDFRRVRGAIQNTYSDSGYTAVAFYTNKALVQYMETLAQVRVHVIGIGEGIIRQVRFDSIDRAIYDIVLDEAVGPENDQSRDWVARREELEEIRQ